MTERFIRDLFTKKWKWVTDDEPVKFTVKRPLRGGLQIIPDIEPYRSTITGEIISGRRQHRDHLRQHEVIEVGNEKRQHATPPDAASRPEEYKQTIAQVMREKGMIG